MSRQAGNEFKYIKRTSMSRASCEILVSCIQTEVEYLFNNPKLVQVTFFMRYWSCFVRGQLLPFLDEMFNRLQDLLVLNAPTGSGMNGVPHLLSDDDQLFVYETASYLVVSSTLPPEVVYLQPNQKCICTKTGQDNSYHTVGPNW